MLRTPIAWAAPFALLAGFACANVQADEIDIPTFNAQDIANWDLSFRKNVYESHLIDRSRFPLHAPAVTGEWLRLIGENARGQHTYATAPGTIDPNLPIHVSYEFISWTEANKAPRMFGFQLFDADLANSLDHLDYCGSKFAPVRVMHGNMDGWGPECGVASANDRDQRVQAWGPGKSMLANVPWAQKLACRNTQWVALDQSWHCTTREEAIAKGFVRTVDAWLTPKDNGAGYRLDVMIDGVDALSDVYVPSTTAERLRFGFLAKADSGSAHAEVRNLRVSQAVMMVTGASASGESPSCINVWGGVANNRHIQSHPCSGAANEILTPVGNELRVGAFCLDVEHGRNVDNARIITWTCSGKANQSWKVTSQGNIRSMMPGVPRCITFSGERQPMRMQACENKPEQRFVALKH